MDMATTDRESTFTIEPRATSLMILDGNKEKLAKKLIYKNQERFACAFIALCEKYDLCGANILKDILDNDDEQILILEKLVFKRAKQNYNLIKFMVTPILLFIPIFGWGALVGVYESYCISYCRNRNRLKEVMGEKFFPFETIKNLLKPCFSKVLL